MSATVKPRSAPRTALVSTVVASAAHMMPPMLAEAAGRQLQAYQVRQHPLIGHGDEPSSSSPKHAPPQTPASARDGEVPEASPAASQFSPASVRGSEAEAVVFSEARRRVEHLADADAHGVQLSCFDLDVMNTKRDVDDEMDVVSRSKCNKANEGVSGDDFDFASSSAHGACVVGNILRPSGSDVLGRSVKSDHGTAEDDDGFEPRSAQPLGSCCVDTRRYPDSWRHTRPRRHAFERPLHTYQIAGQIYSLVITVLFWSSVFAAYFLLYTENKADCLAELVAFAALFGVGLVSVYISFLWISFKDCTDRSNAGELCMFCRRCTNEGSKHCKACNKCVEGFDHHCKWLNMCVGDKNYTLFFCFVSGCVLSTLVALASVICLLARWWHVLAEHHNAYFRAGPIALGCVLLAGIGPLVHLLGFHIYLRLIVKATTYQVMMGDREETFQIPAEGAAAKKKAGCCCR
ncbi:hypothetical protein CUR178_06939 [Leishmania enriettii]|uniref:Palmitoyltransferase n=1 Tax=Leishmania enriettii TaxID=5663 RepID=A0A836HTH7_LEIEN|nr:hypothetical protein CUR178_06939 [Leishmania enriettii]